MIENYNEAANDDAQVWDCHHKKEITENKSIKQLKEEGCYYNVPPQDLIFLTHGEHAKIHKIGMKLSEEHRRKISENHVGMKGKHLSEETRRKISEAHAGKRHSEEWKTKISEALKGKHHSEEARKRMSDIKKINPPFAGKHHSEEIRKRMSEAMKLYWERKKINKEILCQNNLNPSNSIILNT